MRLLIQVELGPSLAPNVSDIATRLLELGIEVDRDYGAICVNPNEGRYVLRGDAPASALDAALPGVELYPDLAINRP